MKVRIGPYREWIGPYQLAEKIIFWNDNYNEGFWTDVQDKLGDFFAYGFKDKKSIRGSDLFSENESDHYTWLYKLLVWIDSKKKRKIEVKLDRWDTWNLDETLSIIIYPLLKQLKETKNGSPMVDDVDVPEELRTPVVFEDPWHGCHEKFAWVLDEMIWAFGQLQPGVDYEDKFYSGEAHWQFSDSNQIIKGPKHTFECNMEGLKRHEERIENGLRLFGKYYRAMWD